MTKIKRIVLIAAGAVGACAASLATVAAVSLKPAPTPVASASPMAAAPESCEGYNAALAEAVAVARRANQTREAAHLLSMRQNCSAQPPTWYRTSAR